MRDTEVWHYQDQILEDAVTQDPANLPEHTSCTLTPSLGGEQVLPPYTYDLGKSDADILRGLAGKGTVVLCEKSLQRGRDRKNNYALTADTEEKVAQLYPTLSSELQQKVMELGAMVTVLSTGETYYAEPITRRR